MDNECGSGVVLVSNHSLQQAVAVVTGHAEHGLRQPRPLLKLML